MVAVPHDSTSASEKHEVYDYVHSLQRNFDVAILRVLKMDEALTEIESTWEVADEHHRTGLDPTGYGDKMRWFDVGSALRRCAEERP